MISFYSISNRLDCVLRLDPILERKYGSVFMLYAILLFTVINGILYVLIYKLLSLYLSSCHLIIVFGKESSTCQQQASLE